jgi:asparagine synthase (glutamine-hydrolysing)
VCGIAAIVGAASRQSGFGKMPVMLQHLAHRGDQPPTWKSYGSAALGSVRLAIVDVERGVQPMESRNLAITFNGEIYNHVELRNQLRAEGLSFATECDTEVLLQGYSRWGEGLLDRIEGMYAFVLVDLAASSFIAARDPFGIKPLYYAQDGGGWCFSSEIRPLIEAGLTGIGEVPPGGFVRDGHVSRRKRYRELSPVSESEMPIGEAIDAFRAEFRQSVERHLPPGHLRAAVFCSGGIDSSALLFEAVRACQRLGYDPAEKLRVFSVGTTNSEDPGLAREVADRLGVPFSLVGIEVDEMILSIPETIRAIESFEPNHIRAGTTSMALARRVAADGFKVALLGEGADELLGGYEEFPHAAGTRGERDVQELLGAFSRQLHLTQLKRVDRTTMAFGIEGRVPFLDSRLTRLVTAMPTSCKVRRNGSGRYVGKYVLREAYRNLLPDHIVDRRKVPMGEGAGVGDNRPIGAFYEHARDCVPDRVFESCVNEYQEFGLNNKEEVEYFLIFKETFGPLGLASNRPMTNNLKTV